MEPVVESVVNKVPEMVQDAGQATERIIEKVSSTMAPVIQPEIVSSTFAPTVEEMVSQTVNQQAIVDEITSQAATHETVEAVNAATEAFVESLSAKVKEPIMEQVIETIVSESQPVIEISGETVQSMEPQLTETVSEIIQDVVTETQTEVVTMLSGDESTSKDSLLSKISTNDVVQYAQETHLIMTLSISMVYLFMVLLIRRLLSKRSPFHLRSLLFLWNFIRFALHVTQTVTLARLLAPLVRHKFTHVNQLVCLSAIPSLSADNMETINFWVNLFTWIKLVELVDTLFVVLRKQQLSLSHIYYRISTLIYAFYILGSSSIPNYYPIMVLVHVTFLSLMSFYYVFRSRSILAPRWIICTLNLIVLIKAFFLLGLLGLSIQNNRLNNLPCSSSMTIDISGLFVVGTNTLLFISYLRSATKPKTLKLL